MNFFDRLQSSTEEARRDLLSTPLIYRAINGEVSLELYVAFLCQAYHHVKHTTPLLMAAGARIPDDKEWMRHALAKYIEEELGHQEWILNDIEACGYDREAARNSRPNMATELMVAYAYDTIARISPLGLFGMVQVLEGTSIARALPAAEGLRKSLQLPDQALTYLRSHGELDQAHMQFFADLMNRIEDRTEQELIVHSARVFYRLYNDVLLSISAEQVHDLMPSALNPGSHAA